MRALNKEGCSAFKDWVLSLDENPSADIPLHFLTDENYSYEIPSSPVLAVRVFSTKNELVETLFPVVEAIERLRVSHDCWPGIWSALSLFYFESVCRRSDAGWSPNSVSYYVYGEHTGNKPKFYEHRIYGPVTLYRTSPESVRPFFQVEPCVLGQYEFSIGSNNELAGNPTILAALKQLYINDNGSTKKGYTSAKK